MDWHRIAACTFLVKWVLKDNLINISLLNIFEQCNYCTRLQVYKQEFPLPVNTTLISTCGLIDKCPQARIHAVSKKHNIWGFNCSYYYLIELN